MLRAIGRSDWQTEAELSHDADVLRWTFYPARMDEDAARERIRHYERRAAEKFHPRFVIVDGSDQILGTCGIGRLQEEIPEVFYALCPEAEAAVQPPTPQSRWSTGRSVIGDRERACASWTATRQARRWRRGPDSHPGSEPRKNIGAASSV